MLRRLIAVLPFAIALVPSLAPAAGPDPLPPFACTGPFAADTDEAALIRTFGRANVVFRSVPAAEGEMVDGMALWPGDPKRRIDVFFADRPGRKVDMIRINEDASLWRIAGLGIGSPLARVVSVNGRAISVSGFGWDYGGSVDPKGGKLERLSGGCRLGLTMDVGSDAPDGVYGDGVTLGSDSALLKRAKPRVTTMFISW